MKGLIGFFVVAFCVQVVLSASCGCNKPSWPCCSDSSNSQLLSEEFIDVDQHHATTSCGCNTPVRHCSSPNCQECRHFQSCQQKPIVIRQPDQKFLLQPAPINIFPRIHQSTGSVNFSPRVYTKQSAANVHIKPVIVKVLKEGKSKMCCRYESVPDHECDSSCCGWQSTSSCGCGCNN